MKALLILAALALSGDRANLSHTYTAETTSKYKISVDLSGQDIGAVLYLVGKKENSVEFRLSEISVMGKPEMDVEPLATKLDSTGLGDRLPSHNAESVYTFFLMSNILPGKEVAEGEPFKIDWKDKEGATIVGTGTLKSIAEEGGKKVAKVHYSLKVLPDHQNDAADVETDSTFDVATGQLLKSAGKAVLTGEFDADYKISLIVEK